MTQQSPRNERPAVSGRAILRYALGWIVVCALAAALALALLEPTAEPGVTMPPIHQIKLERAASVARCQLLRLPPGAAPAPPVARRGAASGTAGLYEEPLSPRSVSVATRRGVIVIQYAPELSDAARAQLRTLHEAVPDGTAVAPTAGRTTYELTVSAWRHLLRCRQFNDGTLDAVRLFRGRYLGSGPDSG